MRQLPLIPAPAETSLQPGSLDMATLAFITVNDAQVLAVAERFRQGPAVLDGGPTAVADPDAQEPNGRRGRRARRPTAASCRTAPAPESEQSFGTYELRIKSRVGACYLVS
jgi:hypothetical protein